MKFRKAAFGADLQSSKGKHIEGIFKSGITISPYRDKISNQAVSLIDKAFEAVYFDGSDINTALRGANEQLNKFMAEEAKK